MEYRILGPLEVTNGGEPVDLGTAKQQALLGTLLLHPNEVVASDRLIDELWGARPPPTASKIVQTYVSQLRRALGREAIETRPPGYLLRVDEATLDARGFRRLAAQGRREAESGNHEQADCRYREALSLWRGPPLTGLIFESFARNELERLEQERLETLIERIDCELALGRHAELVPELELLVKQHPLQERLRGQLMLALYRSDRQAEALAVYQDTRRVLVDGLGLEPSRKLQELERAILTHDDALNQPARIEAPPAEAPASPADRRQKPARSSLVIAAGAVVALTVVLFALLLAPSRESRRNSHTNTDLARVFGPPGRVHPPGYRVALTERLTSGAAEAHPRLGVVAFFDTGVGPIASTAPTRATGEVVFHLDRRQIDYASKSMDSFGTTNLLLVPAGTLIGFATFSPGPSTVQNPLIKEEVTTDPHTGDPLVHAVIGVPPEFIPVLGARYPMTIRIGQRQLVLTLNLQRLVFAFHSKRRQDVRFDNVGFYFFGMQRPSSRTNGGAFVTNPHSATRFAAGVLARTCADEACTRLGPAATDSIRFALPKTITVRVPRRAQYGRPARFSGTGPPGDSVAIAYRLTPGAAPKCTSLSAPTRPCTPRYAPFWAKLDSRPTTVGADGRWSSVSLLRTVVKTGAAGASHAASGRYVAVDYTAPAFGGNANGGPFSVFADAPGKTEVTLATPQITTRRRGKRLAVSVIVPGGDPLVRLVLRLAGRTVASGNLDEHGGFFATFVRSPHNARLEAQATVRGATSSKAAVLIGRLAPSTTGDLASK